MIISVAVSLGILIIFIGRFFEPEKLWYFSLTGLIAPILYLVAIGAALYWIVRWKWRMFIFVTAFVLLGWPYVSLYYKIQIGKEYGTPRYERGNIKVLTYNVHSFKDESWEASTCDSIISLIKSHNPDIICFQEFPVKGEDYDKLLGALAKYNHTDIRAFYDEGVISFSKYRIINSDSVRGLCGTAKGILADLKIGDDTVRLYNLHLQSTSINTEERKYISNRQFLNSGDSARVSKFKGMAERLYENSCMRSHQVDVLRHDIEHCSHPVIICGDFNDIPLSYTYRTLASGMLDTFSEQGNGYSQTFNGFFGLLRIDYILVSKQFRTLSYEVLPSDLSDHYPVEARVIINNSTDY
jgi:endonuclease/exonuclease/phosphatase family metal-dependent hydrolase